MVKKYILDTSVLIADPRGFESFPNNEVILPIAVLDELDKLKKLPNEAGKNARVAIRLLDEVSNQGDISRGILLPNNTLLKFDSNNYNINLGDPLYGDIRIVSCALNYKNENAVLVSRDFNLRIRAKSLGIPAENYEKDRLTGIELYQGFSVIEDMDAAEDLGYHGYINPAHYGLNLRLNECVEFIDSYNNTMVLGKKVKEDKVKLVKPFYPWGLSPRNKEQIFAANLIADVGIPLVSLVGKAGCGKTLIALATCLELLLNQSKYQKFIIYRPIQEVGKSVGFLPGTLEEKLEPWFEAVMDNFELLFGSSHGQDKWKTNFELMKKKDRIQLDTIAYIRGRSIPNSLILMEEVQNLTKEEIKTVLTRVGEGSKIILTGDIEQIDHRDLDPLNNGLTYTIEKFKDSELAGHITFTKGERSALATKASEIL